MIQHLRLKLTAFNTAITGVILLSMTLLCLFVSERDTRTRSFQNFYSYMNTVSTYVDEQDRLSASWLRQTENAGHVLISILDGGKPLFSLGLSSTSYDEQYQQVREQAKAEYGVSIDNAKGNRNCTFTMEDSRGAAYYSGVTLIKKGSSVLEVIVLYPLAELEQQIYSQRVVVFLGEAIAILLLWVFSWHFSGRMLHPIQENQQRQAQFTAAASHELRTPLAAILSAASAMERANPEQQAYFSDMIRKEGRRMSRLIEDMLSLSSADSQSWGIQSEITEVDSLVMELYESYQSIAKEKGLSLALVLPDELLPDVKLDKDRIIQVLSILLDNALTYTPAPGQVKLTLLRHKDKIRVIVADTGPGIPDNEKTRIFDRFYRAEKSRSDRGHFGLGLCIASEIVSLHHGKLWVEDGVGGGAAFILELPL